METRPSAMDPNQEVPALLAWIVALLKRKRFIVAGTFFICVLTGVVTFLTQPIFEATARVIAPPSSSGASSLLSQITSATGVPSGVVPTTGGSGLTADMLNGFLKSNTVLNAVIKNFDLVKVLGEARFLGSMRAYTVDQARDRLTTDIFRTEVDTASGIVTIFIDDNDAKRAAQMADFFVDELVKLVKKLAAEDATQKKDFYERELRKSFDALSQSEDSLKGFQESTGAIQIDEQARAALEGVATIEAQIAAKEVALRVMKTYATPQNPDFKRAKQEIDALKEQRSKLESRGDEYVSNVLIPTGSVPTVGTDYIRKMRDFKFNEALYLLLLKQYESSRIDEAKSTYDVWVVDNATPPQVAAAPKLLLNLMLAFAIGLVLSIAAAFFLEHMEKTKRDNPAARNALSEIRYYLKLSS